MMSGLKERVSALEAQVQQRDSDIAALSPSKRSRHTDQGDMMQLLRNRIAELKSELNEKDVLVAQLQSQLQMNLQTHSPQLQQGDDIDEMASAASAESVVSLDEADDEE